MRDIEAALEAHRNEALAPDAAIASFLAVAREFALLSTGHGFAMSAADVADLAAVRDRTLGTLSDWFDRLVAMAEQRRRNLVRFQGVDVVSLGCDCVSRAVLARWGLKRTAKLGELTGPFDLAVHPPESVRDLVLGGFAGYMDPAELEYRPDEQVCVHPRYVVHFNHDVGPDYAADEFAKLRGIYANRIANFHAAVATPAPLAVVAHVPHFIELYPGRVDCLKQVRDHIAERRAAATTLVIVQSVAPGQKAMPETDADDFVLRVAPLPTAEYVWHWPQCYMSAAGQDYERRIVASVAERLERLRAG